MIDTHAHLDALEDAGAALGRAREAGVTRVVAVGSGLDSCRETLAIAEREEGVSAALGIHPHQAGEEVDLDALKELLGHPKAVAVGETGLDHFRDYAPRDRQAELFRAQAELAAELGLALVVHTRRADEETVAVLRGLDPDVPVVLHCFSSARLLEPALAHGWYVSFAGNVTYPKAEELRWAAAQVMHDRLLAETDSPYLAPQPVRGETNEPAYLVHTLAMLAEARGEDREELEARIDGNAARAFGLA
ncbi:MAG: TatD family hydrolase [Actinobacteria bacterium]|nr:TatD family hydrolase [Actinomycetota bacterium]